MKGKLIFLGLTPFSFFQRIFMLSFQNGEMYNTILKNVCFLINVSMVTYTIIHLINHNLYLLACYLIRSQKLSYLIKNMYVVV